MNNTFLIIAKFNSRYGTILYASKLSNGQEPSTISLDNVFIHTLYYKGNDVPNVGDVAEFTLIKGENGYTYAI